jgi:hypothetical protein
MECEAENAAELTKQYCSTNPGTCVLAAAGIIILVTNPELILVPTAVAAF